MPDYLVPSDDWGQHARNAFDEYTRQLDELRQKAVSTFQQPTPAPPPVGGLSTGLEIPEPAPLRIPEPITQPTEDTGLLSRLITQDDGDVGHEGEPTDVGTPAQTTPSGLYFPVADYGGKVELHWGSHPGASDIFAPKGTPVRAMRGGTVLSVGSSGPGGNNVMVRGDDGQQYYYAHLDSMGEGLAPGARVEAGAHLGGVGDTGNAKGTGPHLHIGIGKSIASGVGPAGGAGTDFDAVADLRAALGGGATSSRAEAPAQATLGQKRYSPFDDVFRKYAGDQAQNDELIGIIAATTKAESGWRADDRTGDSGRSWGLFQMHEAGAGAGMGEARLDPDAASRVMVPQFVQHYQAGKTQGLTGADLASYVARMAEKPLGYDDPNGAAAGKYKAAWRDVSGGGGPLEAAGETLGAVGRGAQAAATGVSERVQQAGDFLQQFRDYTSKPVETYQARYEEPKPAVEAPDLLGQFRDYVAQKTPQLGEAIGGLPARAREGALGAMDVIGGILPPAEETRVGRGMPAARELIAAQERRDVGGQLGAATGLLGAALDIPTALAANAVERIPGLGRGLGQVGETPLVGPVTVGGIAEMGVPLFPGRAAGGAIRGATVADELLRGAPRQADELLGGAAGAARGIPPVEPPLRPPPPPGVQPGPEPDWLRRAIGDVSGADDAAVAKRLRIDKYGPAAIRDVMLRTYQADPQAFETARRGVVTEADVRELAEAARGDVNKVLKRWEPGMAQNQETIRALRTAWATQADQVTQAQQAYKASDTTENLALLTDELTRSRALQEVVLGVRAEAGRSLLEFKAMISPEDRIQRALLRMGKNKFGGRHGREEFAKLMKDTDFSNPQQVAEAAKRLHTPGRMDKWNWFLYNSMLSGPRGRVLDVVSSALSTGTAPLETGLAVPFDIAMSKFTGKRTAYMGEIPAEYFGMRAALADAAGGGWEVLKHGFTPEQVREDLRYATREPFQGKLAGALSMPTRLVGATDVVSKSLNHRASLYAQAYVIAKNEGLDVKSRPGMERIAELKGNPTDEMEDIAKHTARYRAFQDDGTLVRKIAEAKEQMPLLRSIIPFHATPINLLKWNIEHSPLGFAMVAGRAAFGREGGLIPKISQRESAQLLGRATAGTLVFKGVMELAERDLITGPAPRDEDEKAAFYAQGKQPYSFRIGDEWRSYAPFPIFGVMGAAASAVQATREGRAEDAIPLIYAFGLGLGQAIEEQPWMRSLSGLTNAIKDPARYGGQYIEQQLTMPIPQIVQAAARATDPFVRDPENPLQAIPAAIPGLGGLVPERIEPFGQPAMRPAEQQGLGALNPFRPSAAKVDPVQEALRELDLVGFESYPGYVGRTLTVEKENLKLTPEERRKYQQMAGQMAYTQLAMLVELPVWKAVPAEARAKEVESIVRKSREVAADTIRPGLIPRAIEQKAKAAEARAQMAARAS